MCGVWASAFRVWGEGCRACGSEFSVGMGHLHMGMYGVGDSAFRIYVFVYWFALMVLGVQVLELYV